MSEVKNCLTCAYEPEWEPVPVEPKDGDKYNMGRCRFPLPPWAAPKGASLIESDRLERYENCPAHQPKVKIPEKAKQGEPCTRCGQCCHVEICGVMLSANPETKPPCPALGYNTAQGLFVCLIVEVEQLTEPKDSWLITQALGIGKGCCSSYQPKDQG